MQIQSRLPDVGTTIFTVMSRMALEHGAINLSQGFPDFPVDPEIVRLINLNMEQGNNQYAPMPGVVVLREAIARMIARTYSHPVDPEAEITVTAGATQAIFSAIAAFVSPGDEVILFDPSYDSYNPAIRLNGGKPVHINLKFPHFRTDWEEVRHRITRRTRMIMINSPHNPLGTVLCEDDLKQLESIAVEHDLLVLSDEVYERLVYDGQEHQSVLKFPELAARSIACYSFGKTFHATGWKVGYVVAPAFLMKEIRKAHQFIVFSVNTPVQLGLATYLEDPSHYEKLNAFYQAKRDFFLDQIRGSSFEPLQTTGSYFQLLSYRQIADVPDEEMAARLTREFKVASIPVSVFYQDKTDNRLLRFCFAKKEDTLERAGKILRNI
jgi:methionine transaminase